MGLDTRNEINIKTVNSSDYPNKVKNKQNTAVSKNQVNLNFSIEIYNVMN